jgi:hypothetical protein
MRYRMLLTSRRARMYRGYQYEGCGGVILAVVVY